MHLPIHLKNQMAANTVPCAAFLSIIAFIPLGGNGLCTGPISYYIFHLGGTGVGLIYA